MAEAAGEDRRAACSAIAWGDRSSWAGGAAGQRGRPGSPSTRAMPTRRCSGHATVLAERQGFYLGEGERRGGSGRAFLPVLHGGARDPGRVVVGRAQGPRSLQVLRGQRAVEVRVSAAKRRRGLAERNAASPWTVKLRRSAASSGRALSSGRLGWGLPVDRELRHSNWARAHGRLDGRVRGRGAARPCRVQDREAGRTSAMGRRSSPARGAISSRPTSRLMTPSATPASPRFPRWS
jgi:hypothetical protein